jgi:hypothetical protein
LHRIAAQSAHLAFKQNIVNGFFFQIIVAVVPFLEVLPPKLKQFFQIHFAAVEGVCVQTILTLAIHPVLLTFFFLEVHLCAINKTFFNKDIITIM